MQKLPSGPKDYEHNKPVENRFEDDTRDDYQYANENRFGQVFIPVVSHEESIAIETLEAGQVCVVTPNGAVHHRRNAD